MNRQCLKFEPDENTNKHLEQNIEIKEELIEKIKIQINDVNAEINAKTAEIQNCNDKQKLYSDYLSNTNIQNGLSSQEEKDLNQVYISLENTNIMNGTNADQYRYQLFRN